MTCEGAVKYFSSDSVHLVLGKQVHVDHILLYLKKCICTFTHIPNHALLGGVYVVHDQHLINQGLCNRTVTVCTVTVYQIEGELE